MFEFICLALYLGGLISFITILIRFEKPIEDIIHDKLSVGLTNQQLCAQINTPHFYETVRPKFTKKMMNNKLYKMMDAKKVAKTNHRKPIWIKIP